MAVLEQVSMFFSGLSRLMEVWSLFKLVFPRDPDDVTYCSCANFKYQVSVHANKQIPIDFMGVNAFLWNLINYLSI